MGGRARISAGEGAKLEGLPSDILWCTQNLVVVSRLEDDGMGISLVAELSC
jgi:hypothetical protein